MSCKRRLLSDLTCKINKLQLTKSTTSRTMIPAERPLPGLNNELLSVCTSLPRKTPRFCRSCVRLPKSGSHCAVQNKRLSVPTYTVTPQNHTQSQRLLLMSKHVNISASIYLTAMTPGSTKRRQTRLGHVCCGYSDLVNLLQICAVTGVAL